ncbi:MAG: hypothetical protein ACYDHZ_00840 [Dehalococcoidia bacterium]
MTSIPQAGQNPPIDITVVQEDLLDFFYLALDAEGKKSILQHFSSASYTKKRVIAWVRKHEDITYCPVVGEEFDAYLIPEKELLK